MKLKNIVKNILFLFNMNLIFNHNICIRNKKKSCFLLVAGFGGHDSQKNPVNAIPVGAKCETR